MAHKIDSKDALRKLAPRRDPFWHRIKPNHFVGYRYMNKGVAGTWIAKIQDGRKAITESLGKLEGFAPGEERFAEAQRLAFVWFAERAENAVGTGTLVPSKVTVDDVINAWCAHKEKTNKKSATHVRNRLQNGIAMYLDAKGKSWLTTPLAKVTKQQFEHWREWLDALPNMGRGENRGKLRAAASINRELATIRAAFNAAGRRHGLAAVWKESMKQVREIKGRKKFKYLSLEIRESLLDAATRLAPEIEPFMRLQMLLPVRPGAVAQLVVSNWSKRAQELTIEHDKAGAGRTISLSDAAHALIAEQCKNKIASAPIFADADGKPWDATSWGAVMREQLVPELELDREVTMYCIRHSRITDLVNHPDKKTNVFMLAALAGTSVQMMQDSYYENRGDIVREALELPGWAHAA